MAGKGEMDTAAIRRMEGHGLSRHLRRNKGCWSTLTSTVVALAHPHFLQSAPGRLVIRLLPGGLAHPARDMFPNLLGEIFPPGWTAIGSGDIGGGIRSSLIHPTQTNKMWTGSVRGDLGNC
jgi:hypothetical protein